MKTKFTILALLISLLINAQDGTLDITFGTGGKIDYSIFSSFVDMKMDYGNNKLIVIGTNISGSPIIVSYNLDGTYNTSFDGDGIKALNFGSATETPVSLCIYDYDDTSFGYLVASSLFGKIAKIKTDGTYDTTFGANGIYTYNSFEYDNFHTVVINYDYLNGNIVFASHDTQIFSTRVNLYKILPTGGNVSTFNSGNPLQFFIYTGQDIAPNSLNTDDNGNIYVTGPYSIAGGYDTTVRKFSSSGVMDSSYTAQSGGSSARSFSYPGFVFDASNNTSYSYGMDQNYKMLIAKRTATGTSETSFGTNGVALVDFTDTYYDNVKNLTGYEFGSSFKIILTGRTRAQSTAALANISLARIDANGILDTTFGTSGKISIPTLLSTYTGNLFSAIDYDNGKLYVMGFSATGIVSLYRFNLQEAILSTTHILPLSKISFSPNPTTSNISFTQEIENLEIFDLTGKKVKSFGNTNTVFDVADLEKGIYLLKGKTIEGSEFNEKLIKE